MFSKEDKQHGEVWKAAIKYRVKAEVDIPGTKHDLQASDDMYSYVSSCLATDSMCFRSN